MGKGRMTCGTAGALRLFEGEWPLRQGRTLGRTGEVVQPYRADHFSVQSGRRFVVTKYRRAKGAKRVANPLGKGSYGSEGVFQLEAHPVTCPL